MENLSKSFKNIKVLNDISFSVKSGEVYALIGPNGAGKSTLLKIILGLLKADSGKIKIIDHNEKDDNLFFGALIDNPAYYEYLTGEENIEFFQKRTDYMEMKHLLNLVGLNELDSKRKVKEYSLGMRQRLGIAQALIGDMPIIILDEPLNGLDAKGIYDIRKIILKEAKEKNKIVIITGHILSEVEKVADGVMIFNHGKTLFKGKMQELIREEYEIILDKPINNGNISLFPKYNIKLNLNKNIIKLQQININELNDFIKNLLNNGEKLIEVKKVKQSLEDYYFKILKEKE